MNKTATKAVTVFITGANTWCATYLPAPWAAAIGVVSATILAFLVPNVPKANAAGREPVTDWGSDTGLARIVTVLYVLLIVAVAMWIAIQFGWDPEALR